MSNEKVIEAKTQKLYEDIHPFIEVENTIDDYLKSLNVVPGFFRGKEILDCGFGGTGWGAELFVRSGAKQVTGIDLNPNWPVRVGKRIRSKYPDAPLRLLHGTVLELPFEADTFDYVHSHGVMHHTTDWKKGVAEMVRVVKPGGRIYLMLYGRFAPVGRIIHFTYRTMGKIIPYGFMAWVVKKTGLYRDHEISLLDAMYVPIEEHLSQDEIRALLEKLGCTDIQFFQSAKWEKRKFYSSRFMFGKNIQNVVWADKPSV